MLMGAVYCMYPMEKVNPTHETQKCLSLGKHLSEYGSRKKTTFKQKNLTFLCFFLTFSLTWTGKTEDVYKVFLNYKYCQLLYSCKFTKLLGVPDFSTVAA